jgi:hypothetical protein
VQRVVSWRRWQPGIVYKLLYLPHGLLKPSWPPTPPHPTPPHLTPPHPTPPHPTPPHPTPPHPTPPPSSGSAAGCTACAKANFTLASGCTQCAVGYVLNAGTGLCGAWPRRWWQDWQAQALANQTVWSPCWTHRLGGSRPHACPSHTPHLQMRASHSAPPGEPACRWPAGTEGPPAAESAPPSASLPACGLPRTAPLRHHLPPTHSSGTNSTCTACSNPANELSSGCRCAPATYWNGTDCGKRRAGAGGVPTRLDQACIGTMRGRWGNGGVRLARSVTHPARWPAVAAHPFPHTHAHLQRPAPPTVRTARAPATPTAPSALASTTGSRLPRRAVRAGADGAVCAELGTGAATTTYLPKAG